MRWFQRRMGIQAEVLWSLALVMGLATLFLIALFGYHQEEALRRSLGAILLDEARTPRLLPSHTGSSWWWLDPDETVQSPLGELELPDEELLALAAEARRRGEPLLRLGAIWEPIRFAAPVGVGGRIAAARLPASVSHQLRVVPIAVVSLLAIGNLIVFTVVGAMLLRGRIVRPLQDLLAGARLISGGAAGLRVRELGPRETAELGHAFNEMTEILEGRSQALEKAVVELRTSNAELRNAREVLDRAERLAAVGSLAAGVAHEVGNPMGALLTFVELAAREPGVPDSARAHLERVAGEGERVRRTLRQLLDFSRPPRVCPVLLELGSMVRSVTELVAAQRESDGIAIGFDVAPDVPQVWGDEGVIMQVLLNLTLNAADAVAGSEDARVQLSVRPANLSVRAEDPDGTTPPVRRETDAVECVVSDNGSGIPDADREKVFAPFFTTKPPGEGTGLGLANAARLAGELGGGLRLAPAPEGMVTAFVLTLPAAPREPSSDLRAG